MLLVTRYEPTLCTKSQSQDKQINERYLLYLPSMQSIKSRSTASARLFGTQTLLDTQTPWTAVRAVTDGRTDGRTDRRTDATKYIISLASRSIIISHVIATTGWIFVTTFCGELFSIAWKLASTLKYGWFKCFDVILSSYVHHMCGLTAWDQYNCV